MSKQLIIGIGIVGLAAALALTGLAVAQAQPLAATAGGRGRMMNGAGPQTSPGAGRMGGYGRGLGAGGAYTGTVPMGPGMMGGAGANSLGFGMMAGSGAGPMHDDILDAFAEVLGLTRADLDARLAKGETMPQIAAAQGIDQAHFFQTMQAVRAKALAQAVADGDLTQAQADRMNGAGACPHWQDAAEPAQ